MTTPAYGWLRRWAEPLIRRIAPPLHVALRDLQKRYLDRRGMDLKSYFQSCGRDVRIPGCLEVTDPASVAVGHGVSVGEDGYWSSAGGLTVGDRARIGRRVIIETVERAAGPQHEAHPRPVMIGPDVWVGDGAVLQPGTRLGAGAVVASGATVSGDVPGPAASAPRGGHSGHGDDPATRLFFVVSTGRSGSQTIARVLSQHPGVKCLHEPRPQMIRLSTELAHGIKTAADVEEELRAIFCESSVFSGDRLHGESDQKYWNLIPVLARLLPGSKFVWLMRDGRDVVASTFERGWFSEQAADRDPSGDICQRWEFYRLNGVASGALSRDEWAGLTPFERNCWYWAYVNSGIERAIADLPAERSCMVRLEQLPERLEEIFRFLGVPPASVNVERHNANVRSARTWRAWSEVERHAFEKQCWSAMDRLYPCWRNQIEN